MRIGLLSDSHGNCASLKSALEVLTKHDVEAVVHCGDICSLDSLQMLTKLKIPVWLVAGNMDSHIIHQLKNKSRNTNVTFHHSTVEVPLGNNDYLIATHGDNDYLLDELIHGEQFPYVCQGHTHRASDVRHGSTRLICPGALSAPRHPDFPTVAVIDTTIDNVDFYDISNSQKTIQI